MVQKSLKDFPHFVDTETNILNKILANLIQQCIKRIINCHKIGVSPTVSGFSQIRNLILDINRLRE